VWGRCREYNILPRRLLKVSETRTSGIVIDTSSSLNLDKNSLSRSEELESTLERFKHLKKLDLGVLPTTNQQAYDSVKIGLEERGVEVEWKCCRALLRCPVCQTMHG